MAPLEPPRSGSEPALTQHGSRSVELGFLSKSTGSVGAQSSRWVRSCPCWIFSALYLRSWKDPWGYWISSYLMIAHAIAQWTAVVRLQLGPGNGCSPICMIHGDHNVVRLSQGLQILLINQDNRTWNWFIILKKICKNAYFCIGCHNIKYEENS